MILEQEILNLISYGQEGAYWDFKEKWYDSAHEGDLLHDIICMANNQVGRDAYIIIGVEDRSWKLVGVNKDLNRKNTIDLMNFLRAQKFAGDIRPSVRVETISFQGIEIDIIIIENSRRTPFILVKRYRQVKENYIYVRNEDSNTPIDQTADPDKIEYLWKKRFGLELNAIDKFLLLVKEPENWKKSPIPQEQSSYLEILYHEKFPEFTIKILDDDSHNSQAQELYMTESPDPNPFWLNIFVCYHNTVIKYLKGVGLDGGRATIVAPMSYTITSRDISGYPLMFYYVIKESIEYYLSVILGGICHADYLKINCRLPINSILFFDDFYQWNDFKNKYLRKDTLDLLTDIDMNEINNQSIEGIYISHEAQNKDMMIAHAKFSKWVKEKLESFIIQK